MMAAREATYRGAPRALRHLLSGIADAPEDVIVTDVTQDSREVRPGALFLACRGERQHGIEFAAQAAERGARAVLYETPAVGDTRALDAAARLLQRIRQRAGQDEDERVVEVAERGAELGLIADRF